VSHFVQQGGSDLPAHLRLASADSLDVSLVKKNPIWRAGGKHALLRAGDAVLVEPRRGFLLRTMGEYLRREDVDAVLLVRAVADPRRYGVVEGRFGEPFGGIRRLDVTGMVEKPEKPRTHWAATAVYAFSPSIFSALDAHVRVEHPRELEVTDGIRTLLARGGRVSAFVLDPRFGEWRSVGSPEGFARALARTRAVARQKVPENND